LVSHSCSAGECVAAGKEVAHIFGTPIGINSTITFGWVIEDVSGDIVGPRKLKKRNIFWPHKIQYDKLLSNFFLASPDSDQKFK
jgi:hypothetical protein